MNLYKNNLLLYCFIILYLYTVTLCSYIVKCLYVDKERIEDLNLIMHCWLTMVTNMRLKCGIAGCESHDLKLSYDITSL